MTRFTKRNGASLAVCALLGGSWLPEAQALPTGFKESWMNMGEFSRNFTELDAVYTFTQKDAVGFELVNMRFSPKGSPLVTQRVQSTGIHYNRRLARWNGERSQANIYTLLGVGQIRGSGFNSQTVFLPGIQADYETRRVYTAVRAHGYNSNAFKAVRYGAAVGFSFYETDYDEWQPWFILDASRRSGELSGSEVTPTFRLIHKTFFLDLGAPFSRGKSDGLRMNFRYTH
jgi:hypothetical protein